MRKRAPVVFTPERGWHVDLPSYAMVPGSFLPIIAKKIDVNGPLLAAKPGDPALAGMTVLVDLPDDFPIDNAGQVDHAALRLTYSNHARWGSAGYKAPKLR